MAGIVAPSSLRDSDCKPASQVPVEAPRHAGWIRVTHWLTFVCFSLLLITGAEIVISHPRFYWGEIGNVNTRPLFTIHIASSRDTVPTGFGYVMPDQNGWSRALHFQTAWVLVLTGLVYGVAGLWTGHFRKNLLPERGARNWRAYCSRIVRYFRRAPADPAESTFLQRAAEIHLSCRDLRAFSARDLDRAGVVSRRSIPRFRQPSTCWEAGNRRERCTSSSPHSWWFFS